jgi:hypothetical protein
MTNAAMSRRPTARQTTADQTMAHQTAARRATAAGALPRQSRGGTGSALPRQGAAPASRKAAAPRGTTGGSAARYPTMGATALAPARVPARERPKLRAAPPVPVTAPRTPFVVLVLVVVVAGVLGILLINTKINENAFKLSYLQDRQANLDRQEQQLNAQLANQQAPNNLAAQAAKLGLVPAGTPAFIRLPDGRVIGVPQPATSTPSVTSQQASQSSSQAPISAPGTGN